jgi:hypothetical protein
VAGIATGLVATGRGGPHALRREAALVVERPGAAPDLALVDVALTRERFIGARALWRHESLCELFVTFADPGAMGLCSLAGLLAPLPRGSGRGLHVRLTRDRAQAESVVQVALAPGLVTEVAVSSFDTLEMGARVPLSADGLVVALDGEREIERRADDGATVRLTEGPLRIDVDAVMRYAAGALSYRVADVRMPGWSVS